MMEKIKGIWGRHGTKVIGFGSTVLGALSFLDATTIHYIADTFGEHKGHQVTAALMVLVGLGTAWRGFQNSQPK
jgi:hypothetical protein